MTTSVNGQISHYRRDIDGLRAIAVLPIVLFHAGIPGMSGGFVGVDVFFVISGYLITGILYREVIETGKVSFSNFYQRRVRRIAPALLALFLICAITSLFLLYPSQLREFAQSLLSALFFVSNIWFWSESGYFRGQDDILPLLHTWSLSVEEQFYIFMPVAIYLFRKNVKLAIGAALVVSFAGSIAGMIYSPSATFYLLPTRAWELLLGGALAVGMFPALPRKAAIFVALTGLIMIGVAIFGFDESTSFPGLSALLPCAGTAALIYAHEQHDTQVGRLLSTPLLVGVGLISYSLYLWHWPIIIFMRQYLAVDELSGTSSFIAIALSFVCAWASWKWVEGPTRKDLSQRALLIGFGVATLLVASMAVSSLSGLPSRFTPDIQKLASGTENRSQFAEACGTECVIGSGEIRFAYIGDSHAGALSEAVDYMGKAKNVGGIMLHNPGCRPLLDYSSIINLKSDFDACTDRNTTKFREVLASPEFSTIILSARWRSNQQEELGKTLQAITAANKRAIVFYREPVTESDLPRGLAATLAFGRPAPVVTPHLALESIAMPNVQFVDISAAFCNGGVCETSVDGYPILTDRHHVSRYAAENTVGPFLVKQIEF